MNWIQSLSKAINYIENNLTQDIGIDDISNQAYASGSHFQFVFNVVVGITIGEYIRYRRLSRAAQDLLNSNVKISDVAIRYGYETPESFSKAFARFHGIPPSKAQRSNIKLFHPLSINVTIKGGFDMSHKLTNEFHLVDWSIIQGQEKENLSNEEKYNKIVAWAREARRQNPNVFDTLTEWILDDSQWGEEQLAENEQILMQGVLARFKDQNAQLRAYLKELEPSGIVNIPVFQALDNFDHELSGETYDEKLREAVTGMFADFSTMRERSVRLKIAGNKTGPHGVASVEELGYINYLKGCDSHVQWALFMPGVVEKQQVGFKIEDFEYKKVPAMRFIGREGTNGELDDMGARKEHFNYLDNMNEYKSGFDYDVLLMHHYGRGVDVSPWRSFFGRFMMADTPVPEGFDYFDFTPSNDGKSGLPFLSQFAFATFSGDTDAMHKREGYDSDAMYDVTRNIILGQGKQIPYPEKYWTAEVFFDGCDKPGTAYMFSVAL